MPKHSKSVNGFLWAGLLAGLLLTGYGLFERSGSGPALPSAKVAAVVNGRPISVDLYYRLVEGVRADRQGADLPREDRRQILDRMIDEELLIQEAVRIGMASHDRLARGYLVQAMLEFISGQAEQSEPSEGELAAYYKEHAARFMRPGKLALRTLSFDVFSDTEEEPVRQRAVRARESLLAGNDWAGVATLADAPIISVPNSPLDASNVLEYLGPTATRTAFALAEGELSEPVRTQSGFLLIRVDQRWDDKVPPFEEVREEVEASWRRAQAEDAVKAYLADLRSAADINVVEQAVDGRVPVQQPGSE